MNRLVIIMAAALMICGCATNRPIYYWGNYATLNYGSFTKPDEIPIEKQIDLLELDIEKAKSKDLSVPPGNYAQLGYLYLELGNLEEAVGAFETEMSLFPESQVFIKRLLDSITSVEK
ncbi:MAG: DUF4810 domain-containing protein [Opitutales bacterium]|nr:DUF4810 domain-containing protein [Opitutales bacterium]